MSPQNEPKAPQGSEREDLLIKLHAELDAVALGELPPHEELHSWLRNKYQGIRGYMDMAEKKLVKDRALAERIKDQYLSMLQGIYEHAEKQGLIALSDNDSKSLAQAASLVKRVFHLSKPE